MSEQPNALRLAKWLDAMPSSGYALTNQAAAELRRLHEENESLKAWRQDALKFIRMAEDFARAAIAKGEQS